MLVGVVVVACVLCGFCYRLCFWLVVIDWCLVGLRGGVVACVDWLVYMLWCLVLFVLLVLVLFC